MNNYIEPYKRLVLAVYLQAIKDASNGSLEAQGWLMREGPTWLEWVGWVVNSDAVQEVVTHPWKELKQRAYQTVESGGSD